MELVEKADEIGARRRIQALEGLVEHQQLGLEHQRARERDLAPLAARKVVTHLVPQVGDPDALERALHHAIHLRRGISIAARRERHVVPYRGRDDLLLHLLQHHSDALSNPVEMPRRVDAEDRHLALARLQQTQCMEEQRALAAAVRAQDHDSFALLHDEIQAADVDLRAIRIRVTDTRDANDGIAHGALQKKIEAAATPAITRRLSRSAAERCAKWRHPQIRPE